MTWDAKPVKNESESSSGGLPSHTPGQEGFLIPILAELRAIREYGRQAVEALAELKASNDALIQALAEDQGMDESPATTYLNGKSAL